MPVQGRPAGLPQGTPGWFVIGSSASLQVAAALRRMYGWESSSGRVVPVPVQASALLVAMQLVRILHMEASSGQNALSRTGSKWYQEAELS